MIPWAMEPESDLNPQQWRWSDHAQLELEQFITALFEPTELIELRLIADRPGWQGTSLVERRWLPADKLLAHTPQLARQNVAGAHVYFGVNPRVRFSGVKDAVQLCHAIWADIDNVSLENASSHWHSLLPEPSMVVSSGHGVHVYWLLDQPVDVREPDKRLAFETLLRGIYKVLGADATQDISRLLRLPGFLNVKHPVTHCKLVSCHPERRYSLDQFEKWRPEQSNEPREVFHQEHFTRTQDAERIRGLVRYLQGKSADRSRRDFGVICQLLRLGLDPEEIWRLVEPYSKFATAGKAYFEQTIKNASHKSGH